MTPTFRSVSCGGKEGVEIGVEGVTFSTPRLKIARRGAVSVKAKVKTKTSRRTISVTANYGKSASGRPATIGYKKGRTYKPLKKATISRKGLAKFKVRRTSKTKRLGVWLTIQGPQSATKIKTR